MENTPDGRTITPFYMGIPLEVLRRIAETFSEGRIKYDSSSWERYYQTNFQPEDYLKAFDHCIEHVFKAYSEIIDGKIHDGGEDHIAHAIVNLCMIIWATENGKLPNKLEVNMLISPTEEAEIIPAVEPPEDSSIGDKILKAFYIKAKV